MYPLERTSIERNHSDIPQGDEQQHMHHTVSGSFYQPYDVSKNKFTNVSKLQHRNKSFVHLGGHEKDAFNTFLSTTDASYLCQDVKSNSPKKFLKTGSFDKNKIDHVKPLPYKDLYDANKDKKNEKKRTDSNPTITQVDFPRHDQYSKLKLNEVPLKHLKCSHWRQPLRKETYFTTTNSDFYKPKDKNQDQNDKIVVKTPEKGWLQKSNVPLGTMGKHIEGCHKGWY